MSISFGHLSTPSPAPLLGTIRAIFFDAVGTIIHPEPSAASVYAQVGQRHGSQLAADAIRARFTAAFQRQEHCDRNLGWSTQETREVERWRAIVAEVLTDVTDQADCFQDLFEHFSLPASWRCEPETAEVLTALAARGFPLGLASNFDSRLYRVVAGFPCLTALAPVLISSEVGWRKPAPQFAALRQAVDLPPEAILVVGDDPVNDYDGARHSGLQAVLLDPHDQCLDRAGLRITRLSDLLRPPFSAD